MSEGGEENPPPQQFRGPGCSELTKTPRLRPEVVSARRGEPERPSCNKSDLAILLGQVRLRLEQETRLAPRCLPRSLLIHLSTNYRASCLTLRSRDWCLVQKCESILFTHTLHTQPFLFCFEDQDGFSAAENNFKKSEYVRPVKDCIIVDDVSSRSNKRQR